MSYRDPGAAHRSPFFVRSRRRARRLTRNPRALFDIVTEATETSRNSRLGAGPELLAKLKTLIRLVRAYARGEYREIPTEQLILVVAGLVYLVSPIDIVPDFLPGGFLDDMAILSWVLRAVNDEVEDFAAWEARQGRIVDIPREA